MHYDPNGNVCMDFVNFPR